MGKKHGMVAAGPVALVVDDQPAARRLARVVLEDAGWDVVEATSAADALAAAARHHPALVILDHAMPEMTGSSVVGLLRQQVPRVYVAIWSADDRARTPADAAGADACIDKVDLAALEALAARRPTGEVVGP